MVIYIFIRTVLFILAQGKPGKDGSHGPRGARGEEVNIFPLVIFFPTSSFFVILSKQTNNAPPLSMSRALGESEVTSDLKDPRGRQEKA